MRSSPRLSPSTIAGVAAIALFASFVTGCGEKKTKKNAVKDKPVTIDWNEKWGAIRGLGGEGKYFCETGMRLYQSGSTTEEKNKGCEDMVTGINKVLEALEKGDALLDAAEKKEPGKNFTGWGDEMTKWQQAMYQARKALPLDYMDKIKHD